MLAVDAWPFINALFFAMRDKELEITPIARIGVWRQSALGGEVLEEAGQPFTRDGRHRWFKGCWALDCGSEGASQFRVLDGMLRGE